ncbi:MAG: putative sporulation protein YtxC [Clostridia bacterium]|nr:putative sporulation protein YtxC [Clostridia bacterium]
MTEVISIGAQTHVDALMAKLEAEFYLLQAEGIKIDLEETNSGNFTFIGCNIADYGQCDYTHDDTQSIFKHYVANIISDAIIGYYEGDLIKEIIQENYYYFNEDERKTINRYAAKYTNHDDNATGEYMVYQIGRKSMILQRVLEYLQNNNELVIEGFIKFRLKEYLQELQEAVDRAVDDFMMEREYKEFIRLLKYFVEIQEPRVDKVHIYMDVKGVFKLLDEDKKPINNDYLDGFIVDLAENEINYEDLLISALITIAPKEVVLHFRDTVKLSSVVSTIKNVFGIRAVNCIGCDLCKQSSRI